MPNSALLDNSSVEIPGLYVLKQKVSWKKLNFIKKVNLSEDCVNSAMKNTRLGIEAQWIFLIPK